MRRARRDDAAGSHLHRRGVAKLQGEGRGDANLARHRRRGRGGPGDLSIRGHERLKCAHTTTLLLVLGDPGRPRPRRRRFNREIRRQSHRRSRPRAEDVRGATQSGALHLRVSTRVSVALGATRERRRFASPRRARIDPPPVDPLESRTRRSRPRRREKHRGEHFRAPDRPRRRRRATLGLLLDRRRRARRRRDDERTPAGDPNRLDVEHERRRRRGRRVHGDRASALHGERSAANGSAVHAQGPEDAKGALIRHGHLRRDEPKRVGAGARPALNPTTTKTTRRREADATIR